MDDRKTTRWIVVAVVVGAVLVGLFVVDIVTRMPTEPYGLDKACSGKTYREATPYSGRGPHPVAVFVQDAAGELRYEPVQLPGEKTRKAADADTASDVQLVVCLRTVEPDGYASRRGCDYGFSNVVLNGDVPLVGAVYEAHVYELRTHREVRSTRLEGLDDTCPESIDPETDTRLLSKPTPGQWQQLLGDLVSAER